MLSALGIFFNFNNFSILNLKLCFLNYFQISMYPDLKGRGRPSLEEARRRTRSDDFYVSGPLRGRMADRLNFVRNGHRTKASNFRPARSVINITVALIPRHEFEKKYSGAITSELIKVVDRIWDLHPYPVRDHQKGDVCGYGHEKYSCPCSVHIVLGKDC